MVGRLVLPRFNVWFGERNVVFLYLGLAIALEFVIWFVKNLISNGKRRRGTVHGSPVRS